MSEQSSPPLFEGAKQDVISAIGRINGLAGGLFETGQLIRILKETEPFSSMSAYRIGALMRSAAEDGDLVRKSNGDGHSYYTVATPEEKRRAIKRAAVRKLAVRVRLLPPLLPWEERACFLWCNLPGTCANEKIISLSNPPWREAGLFDPTIGRKLIEFLAKMGILVIDREKGVATWSQNPHNLVTSSPQVRAASQVIASMQRLSYEAPPKPAKKKTVHVAAPQQTRVVAKKQRSRFKTEFEELPLEIRVELDPTISAGEEEMAKTRSEWDYFAMQEVAKRMIADGAHKDGWVSHEEFYRRIKEEIVCFRQTLPLHIGRSAGGAATAGYLEAEDRAPEEAKKNDYWYRPTDKRPDGKPPVVAELPTVPEPAPPVPVLVPEPSPEVTAAPEPVHIESTPEPIAAVEEQPTREPEAEPPVPESALEPAPLEAVVAEPVAPDPEVAQPLAVVQEEPRLEPESSPEARVGTPPIIKMLYGERLNTTELRLAMEQTAMVQLILEAVSKIAAILVPLTPERRAWAVQHALFVAECTDSEPVTESEPNDQSS